MKTADFHRKYKLLIDLPNIKAGAVFQYDGGICSGNFYYSENVRITREFIENNPVWFESSPSSEHSEANKITILKEETVDLSNAKFVLGEGVEQAADKYVQSLPEEKWKCTSIVDVEKGFIAGASWDAGKKDAVEFGEWIVENKWEVSKLVGKWCPQDPDAELRYLTSKELYTLFTNSKTP